MYTILCQFASSLTVVHTTAHSHPPNNHWRRSILNKRYLENLKGSWHITWFMIWPIPRLCLFALVKDYLVNHYYKDPIRDQIFYCNQRRTSKWRPVCWYPRSWAWFYGSGRWTVSVKIGGKEGRRGGEGLRAVAAARPASGSGRPSDLTPSPPWRWQPRSGATVNSIPAPPSHLTRAASAWRSWRSTASSDMMM